jgi:hypothetical protein
VHSERNRTQVSAKDHVVHDNALENRDALGSIE